MPTSFSPPAKQTVTQVPQPTTRTFSYLEIISRICSSVFCSATIICSPPPYPVAAGCPVGRGLVPRRVSLTNRAAGDKPPPYRSYFGRTGLGPSSLMRAVISVQTSAHFLPMAEDMLNISRRLPPTPTLSRISWAYSTRLFALRLPSR